MCADPPQKGGYTSPHLQLCIGFTTGIIHNIYIYIYKWYIYTIIYAHVCPLSRATTQSYPRNIYYYIGYIYIRTRQQPPSSVHRHFKNRRNVIIHIKTSRQRSNSARPVIIMYRRYMYNTSHIRMRSIFFLYFRFRVVFVVLRYIRVRLQ